MRKSWLFFLLVSLFAPLCAAAAEDAPTAQGDVVKVYIVNEYRYEPGLSGAHADIGQSLCGTRCNSLSVDYLNYVEPGGWRLIKVAGNQQILVNLNNPSLDGKCICVADEYQVKINDLYMSK